MDANDADRVPEPNAEPDVRDEDTVLADIDGNGGGTLSIVAEHELSQNVNVCAPTKSNVAAPSVAAEFVPVSVVSGGNTMVGVDALCKVPAIVVVRKDDMQD